MGPSLRVSDLGRGEGHVNMASGLAAPDRGPKMAVHHSGWRRPAPRWGWQSGARMMEDVADTGFQSLYHQTPVTP
jgi:hypothetical protein